MAYSKERYDIIIGMQPKELIAGVKNAKGSLEALENTIKDTLEVLKTPPGKYGLTDTKQLKAATAETEKYLAVVQKLRAEGKTQTSQIPISQRMDLNARAQRSAGLIGQAAPSAIDRAAAAEQAKQIALKNKEAAADAKAKRELQSKSITLRYALYDVASAAQQASQSLMGYASSAVMAAAAQEKAFSRIEKTLVGDATTEQLRALRNELIDLSTEIPVSFDELSKIGMLGSQMGIAAKDIGTFTETVAKFSALTEMSVEDTAMAFGKIGGILGIEADQFEALGSAIAAVGFDSEATETQIVSTAGQIGAVATAAGFSASQVVGLSASFASLKIAPEEARGVIVRTFNEISQAVATFDDVTKLSGERLQRFARLAGVTAEEFVDAWGDKSPEGASKVFAQFAEGLSKSNISNELRALGLDGIRTSKGLTAFANNLELTYGKINKLTGEREGGTLETALRAGMERDFLDKSFAVIVDDLSSKLVMLQNSFENLFAAIAGGTDGALINFLKFAIDGITIFNEALTKLAQKEGAVSLLLQLSVAIAAIIGVTLSAVAASALFGATLGALRTAWAAATTMSLNFGKGLTWLTGQIAALRAGTAAASTGFVGMGAASGVAAGGLMTLRTAVRGLLAASGVGLLVVLLGEIGLAIYDAATEAENGGRALDEFNSEQEKLAAAAAKAKSELIELINQGLEPISEMVSAEDNLFKLGQALQQNGKDWSTYSASGRANIGALQSTIASFVVAFGGDEQVLANQLANLKLNLIAMGMGGALAFSMIDTAIAQTGKAVDESILKLLPSLDSGFNTMVSGAGRVQTALEKMTEAFDKAFEKFNRRMDLESSLDDFGKSLAENGKKLNIFTDSGRSNVSALQKVIFSLKDRLAGNPQSLANALESLRRAMIIMGISSKSAFKMIDLAMDATGKKGRALKNVIQGLVGTISESMESAKPLRTITDFANDLSSVLDEALNNRYARQDSKDSITSAWNSIAESAEAAKKSIDDANASINEMTADRNVLEYQLQVAIRYGDTLRAESIKAKLAKLNQQLADRQEDLAEAQDEANSSLVGNSRYAIENRSKIRDLVQGYNEYLVSLAATGMSTEELNAEAAKLEQEFLAQGESMGFARGELLGYTDAFRRDFTTVINNLPREITLNVVTDPALQAIIDFVKDANAELAKVLSGTITPSVPAPTPVIAPPGSSASKPGASTSKPTTPPPKPKPTESAAMKADKAKLKALETQIKNLQFSKMDQENKLATAEYVFYNVKSNQTNLDKVNGLKRAVAEIGKSIAMVTNDATKLQKKITVGGYANGGLVSGSGTGTSDSIPALVSNGEYVLRANAVKYYGADFMNSLNQMQVQRPGASSGSNVIYLSPDDRALLRAAIDRPISLYTENTKIAESANNGNVVLAQRGMK